MRWKKLGAQERRKEEKNQEKRAMKSISVLNFSGVYERESFYKDGDCEWIDCSDLSGVNGFCDEASRRRLRRDQRAARLDSLYRRAGNFTT